MKTITGLNDAAKRCNWHKSEGALAARGIFHFRKLHLLAFAFTLTLTLILTLALTSRFVSWLEAPKHFVRS